MSSPPPRFRISSGAIHADCAAMEGSELHHLRDVLRLRQGAPVELIDERGRILGGRIESIGRGAGDDSDRARRGAARHSAVDPGARDHQGSADGSRDRKSGRVGSERSMAAGLRALRGARSGPGAARAMAPAGDRGKQAEPRRAGGGNQAPAFFRRFASPLAARNFTRDLPGAGAAAGCCRRTRHPRRDSDRMRSGRRLRFRRRSPPPSTPVSSAPAWAATACAPKPPRSPRWRSPHRYWRKWRERIKAEVCTILLHKRDQRHLDRSVGCVGQASEPVVIRSAVHGHSRGARNRKK